MDAVERSELEDYVYRHNRNRPYFWPEKVPLPWAWDGLTMPPPINYDLQRPYDLETAERKYEQREQLV